MNASSPRQSSGRVDLLDRALEQHGRLGHTGASMAEAVTVAAIVARQSRGIQSAAMDEVRLSRAEFAR